jgi:hypothetical protein
MLASQNGDVILVIGCNEDGIVCVKYVVLDVGPCVA